MISGIGNEAAVFLYAVLSGAMVLFGYRILRCVRMIIPHNASAAGAEDLLFWIAASVWIFRRMYQAMQGRIRWYFIAGMLLGAAVSGLILRLFGKIYIKIEKKLEKNRKNR